ncbi:MAG: hypothetical protein FWC47_03595 [Oscillospiraceae bacterium]|nr:hypothetical protein [Oscillospiraceae bacterium]
MNIKKYAELETNMVHNTVECFEKFIEFIDVEKPILSVKKAMLGNKDCFKLNSMLKYSRDVAAPNYNQLQYPIIDLIFNIALDGKLFLKSENEKGKLVLAATPNLKQYQSLNEYEKYVYLFQTYWTKYDFKHKVERDYDMSDFAIYFKKMSKAKNKKDVSQRIADKISYSISPCYYHLEFFGFGNLALNEKNISSSSGVIAIFYPNEFGIKIGSFLMDKAYQYMNDRNFRIVIDMSEVKRTRNLEDIIVKTLPLNEGNPFGVFKNAFPGKNVNKTVDPS